MTFSLFQHLWSVWTHQVELLFSLALSSSSIRLKLAAASLVAQGLKRAMIKVWCQTEAMEDETEITWLSFTNSTMYLKADLSKTKHCSHMSVRLQRPYVVIVFVFHSTRPSGVSAPQANMLYFMVPEATAPTCLLVTVFFSYLRDTQREGERVLGSSSASPVLHW